MSFYLTTPIYYVNSTPHLGHAYTTICADVIARFRKMTGEETFFLTGTDEHGANIAQAAEKEGIEVQAFVDRNAARFRELLPVIDAAPDFFIRTTDEQHKQFVQQIWNRLRESGDIYKGSYSGPYCTSCEAYYAEGDLLEGRLCPTHRREVTDMEETNWFFALSKYEQRLKDHFAANPDWIRPRTRFNEALGFIEGGLEDFSISRSSISWGVPVPFDDEQVTYVWLDALFNYYSALTYGSESGDVSNVFWPPALQLLGKDILRFHAAYWPALLMAAGLELPKMLFIHGYLLMGGDKMSKTQGNVFDPFPVIEQHGPDPVRFYVLRDVQFGQDGSVSHEGFEKRYSSELANDLGNLVSRTASMVSKYTADSVVPAAPDDSDIAAQARSARATWYAQMGDHELTAALETVWTLVRALNRHVEERAPWKLAKDDAQAQLLADTLAELVSGLVEIAFMLSPFMPSTSRRILDTFGVDAEEIAGWEAEGSSWGHAAGRTVTPPEPLFPRLDS
jgi:methionyl-tRNA synthetase